MEDYQDRLSIATPEGLRIDLLLAGMGSRFTAALIDLLIKLLVLGVVLLVLSGLGAFGIALGSIAVFVIYIGYDVLFEAFAGGRTPGKRWSHLRVLRADGRAIDPLSSAIRNIIRLVDGLTLMYVPGMVSILATRRNQRLGDLAARTIVIRELPIPAVVLPAAPPVEGWAAPDAEQRLEDPSPLDVAAVTPDDLAALRAFLQRRSELDAPVRHDLGHRLADAVWPRVGGAPQDLPAEAFLERIVAAKS